MGFPTFFGVKRIDVDESARRIIPAQCCGTSDFVTGCAVNAFAFDGDRVHTEIAGAVVTCAHCGSVHGIGPHGLYDVHPDAMPLAWRAMQAERVNQAQRASSGKANPPMAQVRHKRPPAE